MKDPVSLGNQALCDGCSNKLGRPCWLVEDILELTPRPSIIINARGKMWFANAAARVLLEQGTFLAVAKDKLLRTDQPMASSQLRKKIADLASAPTHAQTLQVVATSSGSRIVILLRRLPSANLPCATFSEQAGPSMLLTVGAMETTLVVPEQQMVEAFEFTPGEARLSRALAEGQDLVSYADAAGIAITTARWHLRNALRKSHCASQRDLVRLVTSLAGM